MQTEVGKLHIYCTDNCNDNWHAVIEVDYGGAPMVHGTSMGHHQVIKVLEPVIKEYLEEVDNESTFFIMPAHLMPIYNLAKHLQEEINLAVKERMEDEKRATL